jgi:glucose uptake protein GlcU
VWNEAINLQRGYKLLIIGGGALAVGIILTAVIFLTFKQTSFNINTGFDIISPRKSIFKTSEVNRGEKMAIGISSKPSEIPMNLQIIERPGLAKIMDVNFTGSLFNSFVPTKDGEDTILITNLGSQQVTANTFFGNSNFFDASGHPKIFMGAAALSGVFLSFAGVIILIIGGIILLIDRRKAKRMKA